MMCTKMILMIVRNDTLVIEIVIDGKLKMMIVSGDMTENVGIVMKMLIATDGDTIKMLIMIETREGSIERMLIMIWNGGRNIETVTIEIGENVKKMR